MAAPLPILDQLLDTLHTLGQAERLRALNDFADRAQAYGRASRGAAAGAAFREAERATGFIEDLKYGRIPEWFTAKDRRWCESLSAPAAEQDRRLGDRDNDQ